MVSQRASGGLGTNVDNDCCVCSRNAFHVWHQFFPRRTHALEQALISIFSENLHTRMSVLHISCSLRMQSLYAKFPFCIPFLCNSSRTIPSKIFFFSDPDIFGVAAAFDGSGVSGIACGTLRVSTRAISEESATVCRRSSVGPRRLAPEISRFNDGLCDTKEIHVQNRNILKNTSTKDQGSAFAKKFDPDLSRKFQSSPILKITMPTPQRNIDQGYKASLPLGFVDDSRRLACVSEFSLLSLSMFSGFLEAAETVSCILCSNRSSCFSLFLWRIRFTGDGSDCLLVQGVIEVPRQWNTIYTC